MTEKNNVVVAATPNTTPAIPADWAALGATSGYQPRLAEELRLWIIGPSNEGKTSFVSSIPDTLILDYEDGAWGIVGGKATRIVIRGYDDYIMIMNKLIDDGKKNQRHWKRIIMDTVDEWASMIVIQLQREKGVEDITEFGQQGHGYNLILNRCWSKLTELEESGYAWGCVGHMRLKEETNPVTKQKVTRARPSIYPGFARQILGKSDFQLTAYRISQLVEKTQKRKLPDGRIIEVPAGEETVDTYYINTLTLEDKEGKNRGVPTMERKFAVPLIGGWNKFVEKYNQAVEEAKQKFPEK